MPKLKVTLIQMGAGEDKDDNLARAELLIRKALPARFDPEIKYLVCLPEIFNFRSDDPEQSNRQVETLNDGPTALWASALASELKIWLIAGSILEQNLLNGKPYNTSLVFGPNGERIGQYRKINLFKLYGDQNSHSPAFDEPRFRSRGKEIFHFDLAGYRVGLAICFDLRFPDIFQQYRREGCQLVVLPSAFTRQTGEVHWEVLLRARAIENQLYLAAPNQNLAANCWGHSMVVSPWGKILTVSGVDSEDFIDQMIDFDELNSIRQRLPMNS